MTFKAKRNLTKFPMRYWSRRPPKQYRLFATHVGCPTEILNKTLLQKTSHTLVAKCRESSWNRLEASSLLVSFHCA